MLIDLILIAFVGLSIYLGYQRGFVRTVSKLICLIISILVAKLLHPPISGFLRKTFVGDFINGQIADEAQTVTEGSNSIVKQAASGAVGTLTDVAVTIVTVIIIIIVVFVISNFAAKSLNLVTKLPFVSSINKVCGVVAGLLMGLLTIYLVFLVIAVVDVDASWLEGSWLAAKMFKENIIMNLIF